MDYNRCNVTSGGTLTGKEVWWIYIATFAVIYAVCLGLSSLSYAIYYIHKKCRHKPRGEKNGEKPSWFRRFHEFVRQLISGDTIPSKILISVTFVCNLVYMILTVYRAYTPNLVEYCFIPSQDGARIVELLVVLELMGFAFIRLLASNNIVLYWLNIYTIIDVLTLPHIFVSIALGVDWLGLRSARFFWLNQLVTVFRFIPYIQSQDIIDIFSLLIYFVVLLFFGTGIVHLLEYSGDPWLQNAVTDNEFFTYAYYIIVTITTVGYGDISPATTFGRIFMVVYIMVGLAFFAALIPVISDVISNFNAKRQYASFDRTRVPRHVIVCGHITAFSAKEFLDDFLHPDRGDARTHILFLHPTRPDKELRNVLRSYYTRVQYIAGSVLNSNDLEKAKILSDSAKAVFILADKYTSTPLEEDNGNLLRLVSIKNTTTRIRVIIQLLLGTSKKRVKNIEGWNPGSDMSVCLNELKLGLLAQSCMCPGFSTLVANLFYSSDFPSLKMFRGDNEWKRDYIGGASNEIYVKPFSHSFIDKNFQEVAWICYNKLGLIILAFEVTDGQTSTLLVNTPDKSIVVKSGTRGYFIGQDDDHASIVTRYCEKCDRDIRINPYSTEVQKLAERVVKRQCFCFSELYEVKTNNPALSETELVDLGPKPNGSSKISRQKSHVEVQFSLEEEEFDEQYSIYLQEPKKLDEAVLDSDIIEINPECIPELRDHIVLCVFADDKSPLLGLHNFLYPLRNKNIPREAMKPIAIVSNRTFLKREWPFIRKIPDVYVVDGSPLRIKNLEIASLKSCSVCIIITMLSANNIEPAINDKEVVLCSLSIQKYLKRNATRHVQIIADLRQESNVQFLDFGDEDEPDERIYKAQPFACGEAFSVSMMDSVTSSAFHSPGTLYLVEDLIQSSAGTKTDSQIVAIPVSPEEKRLYTFRDFYNQQLEKNNLALGLYRKMPRAQLSSGPYGSIATGALQVKHYVITNPNPDTPLKESDIAFVLVNERSTPDEH